MTQKIETMELMLTNEGINFSSNEGWNTVAEHVDVHQQLLSKDLGLKVSWNDALFSWYENIYTPLKRQINSGRLKRAFRYMTSGELYLALSDHWFFIKEKYPDVDVDKTVHSFIKLNKKEKKGFFDLIVELSEDLYASKRISLGDLFAPTVDDDNRGARRKRAA